MIVPKKDYEAEAFRQLANSDFYLPIEKSVAAFTKGRLSNFRDFLYKSRFLTLRESRALRLPDEPKDRRFYLLPKLHKADWPNPRMPPGRPIVSDTLSVSRSWASFIEHFLAPVAQRSRSYVRDSLHVVSLLQSVSLSGPVLLFTMDVTSLYTNIPTEEGVAAVGRAFLRHKDPRRPDLSVLSILRLLLNTNDFVFKGERFLQVHGTAMGSAYGASYANIFLNEWEEKAQNFSAAPTLWIRYIDDIFGIWPHSEESLLLFRDHVNSIHPSIKVTLSFSPTSIRFLDLDLYISGERICHRIGFKPTDSFRILPSDSFHPPTVFNSILYSQIYRWCTRSSTYADFKATKHIVQPHWQRQGYTRSKIRKVTKNVLSFTCQTPFSWQTGFYACKSLTCLTCPFSFFASSVTDSLTGTSFPVIHRLTCSTVGLIYLIRCKNCGKQYVGETARSLNDRISEHLYNIRSQQRTTVSEHFNSSCTLRDFSYTGLEHYANRRKRRAKETVWMKRLSTLSPHGLNVTTAADQPLHLVLPYSRCSQRVVNLCQSMCSDVKIRGSFRANQNLRSHLRRNQ